MLENTEGAIKKGQFRETVKIGCIRRRQRKTKNKTRQYVLDTTKHKETHTIWTLLQYSKDKPNIIWHKDIGNYGQLWT